MLQTFTFSLLHFINLNYSPIPKQHGKHETDHLSNDRLDQSTEP